MHWLPVVVSTLLWPALMCGALWGRSMTVLGYAIAVPPAWWGVMMGGHVFSPFVGSIVYGALPLAMGSCLGHLAGRGIDRAARRSVPRRRVTPA